MQKASPFPELFSFEFQPVNSEKKVARDTIENEIYSSLKKHSTLTSAVDSLVENWLARSLTAEETEAICRFFFSSGLHRKSCLFQLQLLQRKKFVHWYFFASSLKESSIDISTDVWQALIRGAKEEQQLSSLSSLDFLEAEIPNFNKLKLRQIEKQEAALLKLRTSLWETFEFFNSQGVLKEAELALLELLKIFPQDVEAAEHKKNIIQQQLLAKIDQRAPQKRTRSSLTPTQDLDFTETELGAQTNQLLKLSETQPEMLDDLVINSIMSENFAAASQLIERSERTDEDWTFWRIEICLLGRRFAEAISWIESLEDQISDHSEFQRQLDLQYLKAQGLWGLQKRFEALEILESVLQVQPDFRNAQALHAEWKEELA